MCSFLSKSPFTMEWNSKNAIAFLMLSGSQMLRRNSTFGFGCQQMYCISEEMVTGMKNKPRFG